MTVIDRNNYRGELRRDRKLLRIFTSREVDSRRCPRRLNYVSAVERGDNPPIPRDARTNRYLSALVTRAGNFFREKRGFPRRTARRYSTQDTPRAVVCT